MQFREASWTPYQREIRQIRAANHGSYNIIPNIGECWGQLAALRGWTSNAAGTSWLKLIKLISVA